MKRVICIAVISLSIIFVGCTENKGAVEGSKEFMQNFSQATKEYKNNPNKENLQNILDIVNNTDIKLNDEEKKIFEDSMKDVQNKVEATGGDVKILWDKNKDAIKGILEDGAKNFMEKLNSWLNSKN